MTASLRRHETQETYREGPRDLSPWKKFPTWPKTPQPMSRQRTGWTKIFTTSLTEKRLIRLIRPRISNKLTMKQQISQKKRQFRENKVQVDGK